MASDRLSGVRDTLREYRSSDVDDTQPDTANDILSPHQWDDPDTPGLRERLTPSTWVHKFIVIGTVVLVSAMLFFQLRRFGATYQNPWIWTPTLAILAFLAGNIQGAKKVYEWMTDLDWVVVDYGQKGEAVPGRIDGTEDMHGETVELFQPLRGLEAYGAKKEWLRGRDLGFFDPERPMRQKFGRWGYDATGPAYFGLTDRIATDIQTDTLGRMRAVRADRLEELPRNDDVDAVWRESRSDIEKEAAMQLAEENDELRNIVRQTRHKLDLTTDNLHDLKSRMREEDVPKLNDLFDALDEMRDFLTWQETQARREQGEMAATERVKGRREQQTEESQ